MFSLNGSTPSTIFTIPEDCETNHAASGSACGRIIRSIRVRRSVTPSKRSAFGSGGVNDFSCQHLEKPFGVFDVADAVDFGVLQLRRACSGPGRPDRA